MQPGYTAEFYIVQCIAHLLARLCIYDGHRAPVRATGGYLVGSQRAVFREIYALQ